MLIRNARRLDGSRFDCRFERRILETGASLSARKDEETLDAKGRLLLPGLHDHHCHFLAYAASLHSLDCSAPEFQNRAALLDHLSSALRQKPDELRAIGYHEGNDALLERRDLDALSEHIPIRLQHRTGRLWIYNSAALAKMKPNDWPSGAERDAAGTLNGHFFHLDDWLREHYPRALPDIARASRRLAAQGITGLTDAGPDNDAETTTLFQNLQAKGDLLQRVMLMGREDLDFAPSEFLQVGPCKIYLKENNLPDFDALCAQIARQHQRNRAVAFHCVTAAELHFALAALDSAGSNGSDRIEHASLCDDDAIELMKTLRVSVVSQPIFIAERGDRYRREVPADEQSLLYRAQSFIQAGIPYALSSDAPFAEANPWHCIHAAIERRTPSGAVLNADESLNAETALKSYLGDPKDPGRSLRELKGGQVADLILLDCSSLELHTDTRPTVERVWIDGGEIQPSEP